MAFPTDAVALIGLGPLVELDSLGRASGLQDASSTSSSRPRLAGRARGLA